MIRLTGSGPEVVKDDGWAELQKVFERRHSDYRDVLRTFLQPARAGAS